jgi:hypothetical protein
VIGKEEVPPGKLGGVRSQQHPSRGTRRHAPITLESHGRCSRHRASTHSDASEFLQLPFVRLSRPALPPDNDDNVRMASEARTYHTSGGHFAADQWQSAQVRPQTRAATGEDVVLSGAAVSLRAQHPPPAGLSSSGHPQSSREPLWGRAHRSGFEPCRAERSKSTHLAQVRVAAASQTKCRSPT